jgi:hypothetical protein
LEVAESVPSTDGGWTKVERKTKRTKGTNEILHVKQPFTNENKTKIVGFANTNTHKKMADKGNGLSEQTVKGEGGDAIARLGKR